MQDCSGKFTYIKDPESGLFLRFVHGVDGTLYQAPYPEFIKGIRAVPIHKGEEEMNTEAKLDIINQVYGLLNYDEEKEFEGKLRGLITERINERDRITLFDVTQILKSSVDRRPRYIAKRVFGNSYDVPVDVMEFPVEFGDIPAETAADRLSKTFKSYIHTSKYKHYDVIPLAMTGLEHTHQHVVVMDFNGTPLAYYTVRKGEEKKK